MNYQSYYDKKVREVCHGIKENDFECVKIMADYFLNQEIIKSNDILIPAPQHQGYAIYTKEIADIVALHSGAIVKDILKSKPRKTLYEQKIKGIKPDLRFYSTEKIVTNNQIFFVDNVISTGLTFLESEKQVGKMIPLVYGIVHQY